MTQVFLIRHAKADQRGNKYLDDNLRPLIDLGHAQAKTLASLFEQNATQFDYLFSSPLTRAAQTAEPLATRLKAGKYIQYLDALATNNYAELVAELKEWLGPKDESIALVGHEPYLSELASYLLTRQTVQLSIDFKKAAFMCLTGPLEPNEMMLNALVPYEWYKQLN